MKVMDVAPGKGLTLSSAAPSRSVLGAVCEERRFAARPDDEREG